MNRIKAFIPIALLALLIVAMSTNSFALYTQTSTLRGQLYTRVFLFLGSEQTTSYEFGLGGLVLSPAKAKRNFTVFR